MSAERSPDETLREAAFDLRTYYEAAGCNMSMLHGCQAHKDCPRERKLLAVWRAAHAG